MVAVSLPARLDLPAAGPLAETIRAQRGHDLAIDAGAVVHLGGLCLQVLLAAATAWRGDGNILTLSERSDPFDTALGIFGVPAELLQTESAT